jgi:hypothetical protein
MVDILVSTLDFSSVVVLVCGVVEPRTGLGLLDIDRSFILRDSCACPLRGDSLAPPGYPLGGVAILEKKTLWTERYVLEEGKQRLRTLDRSSLA